MLSYGEQQRRACYNCIKAPISKSTSQTTPTVVSFGPDLLDRMVLAVEKVRERLHRSTQALEAAGIPYAVVDGNAVAAWASKVDPDAARNTVDVDLMINRADLEAVKVAMAGAGFVYQEVYGVHMFLDGPEGRARAAPFTACLRAKRSIRNTPTRRRK